MKKKILLFSLLSLLTLTGCSQKTVCVKPTFHVNDSGELIVTYDDGTEENLGQVKGQDGHDGQDGKDGSDGNDGQDGKSFVYKKQEKTLTFEIKYASCGYHWGISIQTLFNYSYYFDYSGVTVDSAGVFYGTMRTKKDIITDITSYRIYDSDEILYKEEVEEEPQESVYFSIPEKYIDNNHTRYFENSKIEIDCSVWEYVLQE